MADRGAFPDADCRFHDLVSPPERERNRILGLLARNEVQQGRYFEARAFYQRRLAAAPATVSVLQLAIQIEERLGDRMAAGRFQQRLREEFPSAATSNPQG